MSTATREEPVKDDEELELERLVFGDHAGFEANLRKIENLYDYSDEETGPLSAPESDDDSASGEDMFYIDEGGEHVLYGDGSTADSEMTDGGAEETDFAADAAWADLDDERASVAVVLARLQKLRHAPDEETLRGNTYVARLRAQYEKIYPRPEWAVALEQGGDAADGSKHGDDDDDAEEDAEDAAVGANAEALRALLAATTLYVAARKTAVLPPTTLEILRLTDANALRRLRGSVESMAFHRRSALLVVGGVDRTARVYHVDGRRNVFVASVFFRDMPVHCVQFAHDSVWAGGRKKFMHKWAVALGDVEKVSRMYGHLQSSYERFVVLPGAAHIAVLSGAYVNMVNAVTGQYTRGFRAEGTVVDVAFSEDDSVLLVALENGTVLEFDAALGSVLRKWADPAAVRVTSFAVGGHDRWVALGTQSGVVNVFDRLLVGDQKAAQPVLHALIDNLVTPVSSLAFTPDGQALCIASRQKKDALRLVHVQSGLAFANWPTSGTPLGRVLAVQFSPDGAMLAVGNDVGKVTLWRMHHYT